ncbi:putative methanogenesis marker protein 17 [Methanohalophilus levihalophilus]|uniref:methanogenesis marker 17 protein n=1 Tax=Methanohalophilus levihalophilus TaxID=1431282 RepID=UPI001AE92AC2|nr:putative methanogenesis marker protein 17 [Methanohalophilus levihalophilus]
MATIEKFVVETTVEAEIGPYRKIVEDVLTDLGMVGRISRIRVVIRPEETLFFMVATLRTVLPLVRVSDIAEVSAGKAEGTVLIELNEEKPLPTLLGLLWDKYGRNSVDQPERRTLIVNTGDSVEIDTIKEMVVDDPHKTLKANLADMAIRASPEGFRVRYHSLNETDFIFVATEDQMKPEWIEEANLLLEELKRDDVDGSSS